MNKTTLLHNLLQDTKQVSIIMEAHNGLSARIAEASGAESIWASGLTISASQGLRDANELSWTQVLGILEPMANATNIPILVDGDTGYGNFNNARIFVKKLLAIGIAGVVFEDKTFPKLNSFVDAKHQLADIGEFCGKIKACKDAIPDQDFCIVARTEALIANLGMKEAICRATQYIDAGADAVVIHSKKTTPIEILEFCKKWQQKAPVLIIPTKYEAKPLSQYANLGITAAIFANHLMRASIKAMRDISRQIMKHHQSTNLDIATLDELFKLTRMQDLLDDEQKYLTTDHPPSKQSDLSIPGTAFEQPTH